MKSKLLKTVVLASSLVFLNCGDDVTSAIGDYTASLSSSSAEEVLPGTSSDSQGTAGAEISSSDAAQPTSGTTVEAGSSDSVPGSSADVGPQAESSSAAAPGAESSANVAASSSSDDKCLASSLPNACGDAPASSSTTAPAVSSSSVSAPAVSSSSSEEKVESSSSEAAKPKGVFLAEGTDETKDQLKVKYIERTGHDGGGILAYPEQLSNDQKHAVVVWGPGGGTEPGAYGGIIRRLASHGFVVIALRESPGNATQAIPALNWLEKKNKDPNDPLYQKLDMTKVGCSGHSMGGLESEQALIKDDRVITAMLNNSGDLGHTAMSQVSKSKTIGIVYGEGGMERPNAEADYNNQGVKAPACLIKMTGGQGNECQQGECGWGHGSGPWGGMAATVAWMRWHLGGEDNRKADFVGSSGKYINGPIVGERGNWKGQCKNF
ncbi:alpha/beta hydrolase [uncultured Fibrobacter sp.]|uniref:poly(ethylene terephthalate) hydrolase family protein n=1 Tax=uncultured Fibrobacter sp. TaxID=261512 RepID=UPI0025DEA1D8|nr:alpha/beta hydrolase [uncultured Fibrobacter sp.]